MPFWDPRVTPSWSERLEWPSLLWSATAIDGPILGNSWFRGARYRPESHSLPTVDWFEQMIGMQRILRQKFQAQDVVKRLDELVGEPPKAAAAEGPRRTRFGKLTDKLAAGKAKRVRLYPDAEQATTLRKWIGAVRWTYNECLRAVREKRSPIDRAELRELVVKNDSPAVQEHPWLRETPQDVRDAGLDDLLTAFKAGFARKKNDGKAFEIKPRSRKRSPQESVSIKARDWKRTGGSYVFLRAIRSSEPLPYDLVYDFRIVLERGTGAFYLCLLQPLAIRGENQAPEDRCRVAAIDPGVRTFATVYDARGEGLEIGKGDIGRIYRLGAALDKLQSKWSQKGVRSHRRWSMRRAGARIRLRIKNLVRDLHCKLAKYLCENYSYVLLPAFETQRKVRRGQRRIGSKTVRAMMTWSHYSFRRRLVDKAREYPWVRVVIVDEAYTTITCGLCGRVRSRFDDKVFLCPSCRNRSDRDLHAARNVLLRFLTRGFPRGNPALRPTSCSDAPASKLQKRDPNEPKGSNGAF